MTASKLRKLASVEYQRAVSFSKASGWKHIRSRGQAFLFCNKDGRVDGWDEPMYWDGKIGSLTAIIAEAKTVPGCTELVLEGGLDGFESVADMMAEFGDYEAGIEWWCVTVWKSEDTSSNNVFDVVSQGEAI